jgi:hypothetical protein
MAARPLLSGPPRNYIDVIRSGGAEGVGGVAFIREEDAVVRGSASPFEIVLSSDERRELERRA